MKAPQERQHDPMASDSPATSTSAAESPPSSPRTPLHGVMGLQRSEASLNRAKYLDLVELLNEEMFSNDTVIDGLFVGMRRVQ